MFLYHIELTRVNGEVGGSKKQGARSTEHGARSMGHGAWGTELGAGSRGTIDRLIRGYGESEDGRRSGGT